MVRSGKKRKARKKNKASGRVVYVRIVLLLLAIVMVASFYVYQRVWVRNLVAEIELLEIRNDEVSLEMGKVQKDWVAASSITGLEQRIKDMNLRLRPTLPDQNLLVDAMDDNYTGRFEGIVKALGKLKSNIPVVAPSEADAEELFEDK